eukprot:3603133-Rhodomonas_salina.2
MLSQPHLDAVLEDVLAHVVGAALHEVTPDLVDRLGPSSSAHVRPRHHKAIAEDRREAGTSRWVLRISSYLNISLRILESGEHATRYNQPPEHVSPCAAHATRTRHDGGWAAGRAPVEVLLHVLLHPVQALRDTLRLQRHVLVDTQRLDPQPPTGVSFRTLL